MTNEVHVVKVLVVKVDRETLRSVSYPLFVIKSPDESILKQIAKGTNVGDFVIIGDKTYRRVRGGFREADDSDMAELIGAQLASDSDDNIPFIIFPMPWKIACRCANKVCSTAPCWSFSRPFETECKETIDVMYRFCRSKDSFKPVIIHRPKEPIHHHAPYKNPHPIFRKHRKIREHRSP